MRHRSAPAALAALLCLSSFSTAALLAGISDVGAPNNASQVMLGFWWDSSREAGDRPSIINQKLGFNVPIFSVAQNFPLPPYNAVTGAGGPPQVDQILATGTDAAFFVTVYPTDLDVVTPDNLAVLAAQMTNYTTTLNRTVYLRFAPEMQGGWFQYGQKPSQFIPAWQLMARTLKAAVPSLILVWAPNLSLGWPNGLIYANYPANEAALLDTNHDGQLTAADDAYAPYYPGDEYVDAVGLSVYYKGPGFQNINQAQPSGYCAGILEGIDVYYGTAYTSFVPYMNRGKPAFFAESGAAYHINVAGGESEVQVQEGWWRDCMTNASLYDRYPTLRGIIQFEHTKLEYDNNNVGDLRDYRLTNDTATLNGFKADLAPMASRFLWANVVTPPASTSDPTASISSALPGTTLPSSGGSLFGNTKSAASSPTSSSFALLSCFMLVVMVFAR